MSDKMTIAELLASKGKRKLTQVYVHNAQEAAACEAAGIDMIVTWERSDIKAIAGAAPNTFLTAGLVYGVYANGDEAKRASYGLMKAGADAIYCPLSMGVVEEMTREGIPVQGHIGYIPFRKSWLGGARAVGKSAGEAIKLYETALAYQEAGVIAIEVEVVPEKVAAEISSRLKVLMVSMGAGSGCDVQYLFADDILGYNTGHVPRHAKVYRDHAAERARIHADSIDAFREFSSDVTTGVFPAKGNSVGVDDSEFEAFLEGID